MRYETRAVPVTYEDGTTGEMALQYPVREKPRVYIVGCAGSKTLVPWDDAEAEYWGVNNLYGVDLPGSHFDRWFEIHNIWQDPRTKKLLRRGQEAFRGLAIPDYLKGLAALNCCVYTQKHWPTLLPLSIPYPLDDIVAFFASRGLGTDLCRYLTNTIAYEIVLAIYLGFSEIEVWGVDLAVGTEYEHQRPSCEFWLGVAAGMGIRIHVPAEADLLKTRFLYGFEEKQQDLFTAKVEKIRQDMKQRRLQAQARHAEDGNLIQQSIGGEHVLADIQKIWANLSDDLRYQKRGT